MNGDRNDHYHSSSPSRAGEDPATQPTVVATSREQTADALSPANEDEEGSATASAETGLENGGTSGPAAEGFPLFVEPTSVDHQALSALGGQSQEEASVAPGHTATPTVDVPSVQPTPIEQIEKEVTGPQPIEAPNDSEAVPAVHTSLVQPILLENVENGMGNVGNATVPPSANQAEQSGSTEENQTNYHAIQFWRKNQEALAALQAASSSGAVVQGVSAVTMPNRAMSSVRILDPEISSSSIVSSIGAASFTNSRSFNQVGSKMDSPDQSSLDSTMPLVFSPGSPNKPFDSSCGQAVCSTSSHSPEKNDVRNSNDMHVAKISSGANVAVSDQNHETPCNLLDRPETRLRAFVLAYILFIFIVAMMTAGITNPNLGSNSAVPSPSFPGTPSPVTPFRIALSSNPGDSRILTCLDPSMDINVTVFADRDITGLPMSVYSIHILNNTRSTASHNQSTADLELLNDNLAIVSFERFVKVEGQTVNRVRRVSNGGGSLDFKWNNRSDAFTLILRRDNGSIALPSISVVDSPLASFFINLPNTENLDFQWANVPDAIKKPSAFVFDLRDLDNKALGTDDGEIFLILSNGTKTVASLPLGNSEYYFPIPTLPVNLTNALNASLVQQRTAFVIDETCGHIVGLLNLITGNVCNSFVQSGGSQDRLTREETDRQCLQLISLLAASCGVNPPVGLLGRRLLRDNENKQYEGIKSGRVLVDKTGVAFGGQVRNAAPVDTSNDYVTDIRINVPDPKAVQAKLIFRSLINTHNILVIKDVEVLLAEIDSGTRQVVSVQKTVPRCNGIQVAGDDEADSRRIVMNSFEGEFKFTFQTYSIPDRIVITQNGQQIFDSTCKGTEYFKSVLVQLNPATKTDEVVVAVTPNCDGTEGTLWEYIVACDALPYLECPDDSAPCRCKEGAQKYDSLMRGLPVGRKCGSQTSINSAGVSNLVNKFSFGPGLNQICKVHNECYGTCGKARSECDSIMNSTATTMCSTIPDTRAKTDCLDILQFLMVGVDLGGSASFKASQLEQCYCGLPPEYEHPEY